VVGALALALVLPTAPAVAGAAPGKTAQVVTITATGARMTVTGDAGLRQGPTTFAASTSDAEPHWFGVVRPNAGVPLDRYLDYLTDALSDDPPTSVEGEKKALRHGRLFSGAAVTAGRSVRVTVDLDPGTYYLVDYATLGQPGVRPAVHPIQIGRGKQAPQSAPKGWHDPDTVAVIRSTPEGDRFVVPSRLPARGTLLARNATDQMNEAVLMRLHPWATEADVRHFFIYWGSDGVNPFVDYHSVGLIPMSPNHSALLTYDLEPGKYTLMSWVRNLETGNPNVVDGTFTIVELVRR